MRGRREGAQRALSKFALKVMLGASRNVAKGSI